MADYSSVHTGTEVDAAVTTVQDYVETYKAKMQYLSDVTSAIQAQIDGKQAAGSYVTTNSEQTISGVKTFSSAPIVSTLTASRVMVAGADGITQTCNLTTTEANALNGKTYSGSDSQIQTGSKDSEFVIPMWNADGDLVGSALTAQQLDGKAEDDEVVHNTGDEPVAGTKTFSSAPKISTLASGKLVEAGTDGLLQASGVEETDLAKVASVNTFTAQNNFYGMVIRTTEDVAAVEYDVDTDNSNGYTDYILGVSHTATAPVQINLPAAASSAGRELVIKDTGGNCNANNITVIDDSPANIDSAASFVMNIDHMSITLYCDGTQWWLK